MVFLIWLVLFLLFVSSLVFLLAVCRRAIFERYSGGRPVVCPENQESAFVTIDAQRAAVTAVDGRSDLRLCDCTRWPERAHCGQECLSQAIQAEPYTPGRATLKSKRIYHLPVLLAAFAAWYVGAIWHSHYLFRAQWMHSVGLAQAQVKQIVWWLSPHLLTAAVCLLFAYGVAWLLAVSHRKGVLQGLLMSAALGGTVIAMSSYAIVRLPREFFMIEVSYAFLAVVTVGAIVGGLYDKLVMPRD